ncbi:MAG: VanZ family protein [Bacteroidota bacterium]|nr:VanZ family protein [Bacteroidota bacterium]
MDAQKYWRTNGKRYNITNKFTYVLFAIYLIALFWILLFKLGVHFSYMGKIRSINLIPFSEPLILNGKTDFGEIILNILIFVPLGLYAGILFKQWSFGKKLFFFFLISLLIEGLQFILRLGASDVTDIITNTLGGIIGLMAFTAIEKVFKNSVKAQRFINIIAAIGSVLIILILVLLKVNSLWIFRMNTLHQTHK